MLSWQRKRDEDRKKLMNEKLNNKLDNERPKNYMPKNDKLKNEKLENTTEIKPRNSGSNTPSTLSTTTQAQPKPEITDFRGYASHNPDTCDPACAGPSLHPFQICPLRKQTNKRAADEELKKEREAKRAARRDKPSGPRVGDWQCLCGHWNNKFWFYCRRRRTRGKNCSNHRCDEHIVKRQAAGEGIEEQPPQHFRWDGDWKCVCHWWNREYMTYCSRCIRNEDEGWEYTARDGVDGKLSPRPVKEPDGPSEASKRQTFFATHKGPWRPHSRRYGGWK